MRNLKNKIISILIVIGLILNSLMPVILAVEKTNNTNETIINNTINENNEIVENQLEKNNIIKENETKNEITNNTSNEININENKTNKATNKIENIIESTNNNTTNKEENNIKKETDKSKNIEEKATESNNTQIENDESLIMPLALDNKPNVIYKTHIQNVGWQGEKTSGQASGTEGKSLRLEAIKINLTGFSSNVKIKYQAHIQNIGWQDWKQNGQLAGTEGKSLRMEAIKINLESSDEYTIMYRVHIQNIGWQDWKKAGEIAGTVGQSLRLEAIQIKIVEKEKKVNLYIETPSNNTTLYTPKTIDVSGWRMATFANNKVEVYVDNIKLNENNITYNKRPDVIKAISGYGTEKQNPTPGFIAKIDSTKLLDGNHTIKINVISPKSEIIQTSTITVKIDRKLHIQYRSHVQNIGWMNYVMDGQASGTEAKSLRIEAMNINLINVPSNAKILYRTHVQNVGWQDWKENGQKTGTEGLNLRIEAIEIKLQNMDKYTVEYQVHIQDVGWTGWYIDGEMAGTIGRAKRIESIRIRLTPKYKRNYKGIDVSQFNGNINWGFVKRDNIDFAFIRVGYRGYGASGNFAEDIMFKKNMQAAKAAGIPVGVYFVTQAITEAEAVEEANWVLQRLKEYDIQYPVAIDIEKSGGNPGRADNLDKETRTKLANIFCKTIQNSGYIPIIYANINWAENYLDMSKLSEYDTWIAHYKYDINSKPNYNKKYSIWQYSDIGSINGILGNVDLNVCYKKY